MNLKKFSSYLAMIAISLLMFTACGEDDTDGPVIVDPLNPTPAPVTRLFAGTTDETTIYLQWTHSASFDSTWFGKYIVIAKNMTTQAIDTNDVPASNSVETQNTIYFEYDDATNGTIYDFTILAVSDSGVTSTPETISWATSKFFETNDNGAEIKIYGSDSDFGSGLQLYGDGLAPTIWKVADQAKWNLGLTTAGGVIKFGSASMLGYSTVTSPADAAISQIMETTDVETLDQLILNGDISGENFEKRVIDLTASNVTSKQNSITFFVRTGTAGNYNYARVMILKSNGSFLQDAGEDNEFVQVYVSYQTATGVPYAKIFARSNYPSKPVIR
jgi:hypothetical protein